MRGKIRNGGERMSDQKLIMSFASELDKKNVSDIINSAYIAKNIFKLNFMVSFKGKGNLGVDSPEIRRILIYNRIKTDRNYRKASEAAKHLSKISSRELGWLAQYLFKGKKHLYEKEVIQATRIRKNLMKVRV